MKPLLLNTYRCARVLGLQALRVEPWVPLRARLPLEFHGDAYCGWYIPRGRLDRNAVVVDVGLGENISFSTSLMARYGCRVSGFDPTPRAIQYVKAHAPPGFVLHEVAVAAQRGSAEFYLPNEEAHVSGSLAQAGHVGARKIQVELISLADLFERIGTDQIDLLKLDIEGAEYPLIDCADFRRLAPRIGSLCIEFHHRWEIFGSRATRSAVQTLESLGLHCAWRSRTTNKEFLFVRDA